MLIVFKKSHVVSVGLKHSENKTVPTYIYCLFPILGYALLRLR